jgi:hypothetical protein
MIPTIFCPFFLQYFPMESRARLKLRRPGLLIPSIIDQFMGKLTMSQRILNSDSARSVTDARSAANLCFDERMAAAAATNI